MWHIGCSGFYYNHWKGLFYPEDLPKSRWFDYYKERFNTLELNVTFYRFPKLSTFESWYKKSPPNFSFAVKAPRLITHYKQFHDTAEIMAGYYEVIKEGLKDKLGAVLFQLPPRADYNEERLNRIIETMDNSIPNVVEFRHQSWWNQGVYDKLGKNKISFCGISHPTLPEEMVQNTSLLYYRFHGVPELYKSKYSPQKLSAFSKKVTANKHIKNAFVYFNNDIGGSAIENAVYLKELQSK